jgi:hypothetical protein
VPRLDVYECEIREWVKDPVTKKFVEDSATGRLKFEWRLISVEEALRRADKPSVRCRACHGPIRLCKTSIYRWTGGPRAHAAHLKRFSGCPLGCCFDGTSRMSPTPVEF